MRLSDLGLCVLLYHDSDGIRAIKYQPRALYVPGWRIEGRALDKTTGFINLIHKRISKFRGRSLMTDKG